MEYVPAKHHGITPTVIHGIHSDAGGAIFRNTTYHLTEFLVCA